MKGQIFFILAAVIAIASCTEDMRSNAIFRLKGCDASIDLSNESVQGTTIGRDLMLRHNGVYSCCADISVRLLEKGNLLIVDEENTAKTCGCLCTYAIDTALLNIAPGNYTLILHGVGHDGTRPANITYSKGIVIPSEETWEDVLG